MCRKKELFAILCICFSLVACEKKEEFTNNKMSSEYAQNQADYNQNKVNGDQIPSQNAKTEGTDVNDNSDLQIDIEDALVYGNVSQLIENGCILQKGIENDDEYAAPVGEEQKQKEEQQIIYDSDVTVFVKYYENDAYEKATLEDIKKNTFIYVFGETGNNNSIIADQIVILRTTVK